MGKKSLLLFLIFLLFCPMLVARHGNDVVKGIFLIKNPNEVLFSPPRHIRIGIEMIDQAYFKLSSEEMIIGAGILLEGINSLQIPSEKLFKKTEKITFYLELKKGDTITKKDIILDIQLVVMEKPEQKEAEKTFSSYKLSLFIEDQLISTKIKHLEIIPAIQPDLSKIAKNDDPFYVPKEPIIPMGNSVSILDALGLAYSLIKSAVTKEKKEGPELSLQYTHSLTLKFPKMNAQGTQEEVFAMIVLTTK